MAAFEYKALDGKGRNKSGVLEGDSARQVRQLLREQGLTPLEVNETTEKAKREADSGKILDQINDRIDRMRDTRLARMSPALRRYHDAYEAARRAEEAGTTLEAMGVDPFAEGFDAGALMLSPEQDKLS